MHPPSHQVIEEVFFSVDFGNAEPGSFVSVGPCQYRHLHKLAFPDELAGIPGKESAVNEKVPDLARLRRVQLIFGQAARTGKLTNGGRRRITPRSPGKGFNRSGVVWQILNLAPSWAFTFKDGAPVELVVSSAVAEKVVRDALFSRALSPHDEPFWIASKGDDILLKPP